VVTNILARARARAHTNTDTNTDTPGINSASVWQPMPPMAWLPSGTTVDELWGLPQEREGGREGGRESQWGMFETIGE